MAKQEECSKCKRAKQGGYAGEIKCSFYGRKPVFDDSPCSSFLNVNTKCSECGQEVPPSEKVCPNCGCPLTEDVTPSKNIQLEVSSNANNTTPQTPHKSGTGKVLLFVLVGIALVAGTVFVMKSISSETQHEEESAKQEMIPMKQEEAGREEARMIEVENQQQREMNNLVGIYRLDRGGDPGQETGIEILADGRCLAYNVYSVDGSGIRKVYIGDVNLLGNGTFQIPIADYSDLKSIDLAYFKAGSEEEKEGRASYWPNWSHSRVHELLFERVGYGLCVYESVAKYRNKDVSEYYYAKFYKK
ncbi:MAG: hypothetical protein J6X59_03680 [Bacteroidales bacterium]|nr:hypothetical protein [Bacteroidales bacterium]